MKAIKVYEFIQKKSLRSSTIIGQQKIVKDIIDEWISLFNLDIPIQYKINNHNQIEILSGLIIPFEINYFPDIIKKVHGVLLMEYSHITKLPDNLTIINKLDLKYSNIKKLPDNLTILKYKNKNSVLNLIGTNITKLPDNLIVDVIYSDNLKFIKKIHKENKYAGVYYNG